MILGDQEIIARSHLLFPYENSRLMREQIQPASVDLTVSNTWVIDGESVNANWVTLERGDFILASSREWVSLQSDVAGMIHGKSSVGRKGLFIQNAGWIDPGFRGQLTLEFFYAGKHPLAIMVGNPICQVVFHLVSGSVIKPYGHEDLNSKYQDQRGATPPRD